MYFSYIYFYKKTGLLLFDEKFEAWVYGPVLREIYYHTRDYGLFFNYFPSSEIKFRDNKIVEIKTSKKIIPDLKNETVCKLIDEALIDYSKLSAMLLVAEAHKSEYWIKARNGLDISLPSDRDIIIN